MRFEEVLPALKEGKKIGRKKRNKGYYYEMTYKYGHNVIVDNHGEAKEDWEDVLADDWEIFEAPKKVKLRDLSKRKYVNWWYRHCFEQNKCEVDCPLKNAKCDARFTSSWINHKDLYSDKFLDQEIEVEE